MLLRLIGIVFGTILMLLAMALIIPAFIVFLPVFIILIVSVIIGAIGAALLVKAVHYD